MNSDTKQNDSDRTVRTARYWPWLLGASTLLCAQAGMAQDEDYTRPTFRDKFIDQVVEGTELTGRLGIYDFRRWHDTNRPFPNVDDQDEDFDTRATAYGGDIYAQTGMLYGFSGGFGISFADSIHDYDNPNANLIGADGSIHAVTQGYLQYNLPGLRVRAGRQLINTPFASTDQFTFIPRSFSGGSVALRPLEIFGEGGSDRQTAQQVETGRNRQAPTRLAPQNYMNDQYMPFGFDAGVDDQPTWQLFAARMTRYESRFTDEFTTDNRYVEDTAGLFTAGTTIRQNTEGGDFIGQVWHYTFFDTAKLQYAEAGYEMPTLMADADWGGFEPYVRAQYVHETETGSAKLGNIDADVYGAKLGVHSRHIGVAVVGHYSPLHESSFRGGQVAHPYSDLSGLFYTDTMNDGVGNLGPGYGLGGRIDIQPSSNLELFTRYVHYEAKRGQSHAFFDYAGDQGYAAGVPIVEDQNSWGWDNGVTLDLAAFSPQLEGLKIQNILGITDFDGADRFYDNRLRIFYEF